MSNNESDWDRQNRCSDILEKRGFRLYVAANQSELEKKYSILKISPGHVQKYKGEVELSLEEVSEYCDIISK